MEANDYMIFSGSANEPLAKKIASRLGKALGSIELKRFNDGEIWVKYQENIRYIPAKNRNGEPDNVAIIWVTYIHSDDTDRIINPDKVPIRASYRRNWKSHGSVMP